MAHRRFHSTTIAPKPYEIIFDTCHLYTSKITLDKTRGEDPYGNFPDPDPGYKKTDPDPDPSKFRDVDLADSISRDL